MTKFRSYARYLNRNDPVPQYALHPGWIVSKTDGQRHFISSTKLARLYELRHNEYIVWDEQATKGRNYDDYIHLFPNYHGLYGRPK